jgi:hypothetical protein
MDIFLIKKNKMVIPHTDLTAMEELDGVKTPDKTVSLETWEAAGSTAHIDSDGNIQLGIPPAEKARQDKIAALETEKAALQMELDSKDYRVWKAAEVGLVLANIEPKLHERRDWCRTRIDTIREQLKREIQPTLPVAP